MMGDPDLLWGWASCEQVVTDAKEPQTSAVKLAWLIMIWTGGAQILQDYTRKTSTITTTISEHRRKRGQTLCDPL